MSWRAWRNLLTSWVSNYIFKNIGSDIESSFLKMKTFAVSRGFKLYFQNIKSAMESAFLRMQAKAVESYHSSTWYLKTLHAYMQGYFGHEYIDTLKNYWELFPWNTCTHVHILEQLHRDSMYTLRTYVHTVYKLEWC